MRLTSHDLLELSVIDGIIDEPLGGAHRDIEDAARRVGDALAEALDALRGLDGDTLQARRREKFLEMGRSDLA